MGFLILAVLLRKFLLRKYACMAAEAIVMIKSKKVQKEKTGLNEFLLNTYQQTCCLYGELETELYQGKRDSVSIYSAAFNTIGIQRKTPTQHTVFSSSSSVKIKWGLR